MAVAASMLTATYFMLRDERTRLLDPPASLQMSQVQVLIALSSPFQNSQLAGTEQTQPTCLWV